MLTKNINLKEYSIEGNHSKIKKKLKNLLNKNFEVLESLKSTYKNSYKKKLILKLKNHSNLRIIGMGGSILGIEAIYNFLKFKITKSISFIDNLSVDNFNYQNKKKSLNIIISKSGNTLETISNTNILIKKKRYEYFYYRK